VVKRLELLKLSCDNKQFKQHIKVHVRTDNTKPNSNQIFNNPQTASSKT